jgi:subtilisin-like proprotein convertase family protein
MFSTKKKSPFTADSFFRSLCVLVLLVVSTNTLKAQVDCICTNCPVPLPDVLSTTFNGYLQVSGATNNVLGGNNCLESVCINISHSWIGDLDISLTSPDGTTIILFADGNALDGCPCGNDGEDLEVCFTLPGQSTNGSFAGTNPANCTDPIYFMPCNGTIPCFSGTWEPWDQLCGIGGLDVFNNGTGSVDGLWIITINDNAGIDQGTLDELEINFCDDDGIVCLSVDPGCLADAGSLTTVFAGSSATPNIICDGGSVDIQSNGDYTLPDPGCLGCTPDLIYAIYTNGGPSSADPDTDPNFSLYYWTGPDFTTGNSAGFNTNTGGAQSLISQLIPSADNTWCFVPITADANDIFDLDHDLDGDGCFDLGTPVCFQFLNPISAATQSSCSGTISIALTGGYPEFNGGNFTVTNTGSGTLSPTSVAHGGTFNINGLTNGQSYSYTVNSNGCSRTFSGTYSNTLSVTLAPATATVAAGSCVALSGAVTASGGNVSISNYSDYNIPDDGIFDLNTNPLINTGSWITSPIDVSGICPATYSTGRIMSVCMIGMPIYIFGFKPQVEHLFV